MTDAIVVARERMRQDERRKNRQQMPNLAALVDELREQFPGAKLVWGQDLVTGHSIGQRPDESNAFQIPPDYYPTRAVDAKGRK